jgi:hypothetical protein
MAYIAFFLQGLIAIGRVNGLFIFQIIFVSPDKIGNKILSPRHAAVSEG